MDYYEYKTVKFDLTKLLQKYGANFILDTIAVLCEENSHINIAKDINKIQKNNIDTNNFMDINL